MASDAELAGDLALAQARGVEGADRGLVEWGRDSADIDRTGNRG